MGIAPHIFNNINRHHVYDCGGRTMSVLNFFKKDKQDSEEREPVGEAITPVSPQLVAVSPQGPVAQENEGSGGEVLDFDEIRCALDQIADVLGRGEGYDMLKATAGDVTAVELSLKDLLECKPELFDVNEVSPADEDKKANVLIKDIFTQLGKGKIVTTVGNLVADIPNDYLVQGIADKREEEVSLPLPLVVSAINPDELQKRTTNVERNSGISDLPNLFNPPSVEAETPVQVDVSTPEPVVDEITQPEPVAEETVAETVEEAPVETPATETLATEVIEEELVAEEVEEPVAEEVEETWAQEEPVAEVVEETWAQEEPVAEEIEEPVAEVVEETWAQEEPVAEEVEELVVAEVEAVVEEQPVVEEEPVAGQLLSHPAVEDAAAPSWSDEPAASTATPDASDGRHVLNLRGLDLNRATVSDLISRLDGVGPRLATRIISDREKNGPFLDILDLARVPGLGKKTFSKVTHMRWPEGEEALPEMRKDVLTFNDGGYLNVREVASRFGQLPGFAGCVVAHTDGYIVASSWDHKSHEALGAFAPQIFKKVARYIKRLDMGEMDCMTVIMDQTPITFVPSEDVYFVAIHKTGALSRKHVRLAYGVGCRLGRLLKRHSLAAA
jgi:competence ComEA-like helix-hairpin-helix protein